VRCGWVPRRWYCLYRRTADEAPARAEEIHHAQQEGVEFHWLTTPMELLGDDRNNVRAMRCERMQLGEPDASGRRRPVPVPGSSFELDIDMVVYAIGTNANPIIGQTSGSSSTSAASSPPTSTWPPRWPACLPVATSSPAPPP
jgi:NADPH-dependent glutamate synthase beta subunit-like oxidoreductase